MPTAAQAAADLARCRRPLAATAVGLGGQGEGDEGCGERKFYGGA